MLDVVQPDGEHLRRCRRGSAELRRVERGRLGQVCLAGPGDELVPHLVDVLRVRAEPSSGGLLHIDGAGLGEQGQPT
jgi:hypothetical protein